MTDHTQTNIGALGTEDPWTGGDPRYTVLARVSFGHEFGPCELVASVIPASDYFGVKCLTYDTSCAHPHEPVIILATGTTLFGACLEIYSCRRPVNDRTLILRMEETEANQPRPEREAAPVLSPTHAPVRELWIPPDYVESLYAAAAANYSASKQTTPASQPPPAEVTA